MIQRPKSTRVVALISARSCSISAAKLYLLGAAQGNSMPKCPIGSTSSTCASAKGAKTCQGYAQHHAAQGSRALPRTCRVWSTAPPHLFCLCGRWMVNPNPGKLEWICMRALWTSCNLKLRNARSILITRVVNDKITDELHPPNSKLANHRKPRMTSDPKLSLKQYLENYPPPKKKVPIFHKKKAKIYI